MCRPHSGPLEGSGGGLAHSQFDAESEPAVTRITFSDRDRIARPPLRTVAPAGPRSGLRALSVLVRERVRSGVRARASSSSLSSSRAPFRRDVDARNGIGDETSGRRDGLLAARPLDIRMAEAGSGHGWRRLGSLAPRRGSAVASRSRGRTLAQRGVGCGICG